MKKKRSDVWCFLRQVTLVLFLMTALVACGGDSDDDDDFNGTPTPPSSSIDVAPPETTRTVTGTIDTGQESGVQALAITAGATLSLDDDQPATVHDQGRFEIRNVEDGNHSLYLHHPDGMTTEIPFRMTEGRSLALGTVTIINGQLQNHTGFNGYRFGFIDENGDGINDLFIDDDGDGICDNAGLYAGYPYLMGHGWTDADGNGINDRFRDHDGDGINDRFIDADGDGVCDLTQGPFAEQPFFYGYTRQHRDANGDGIDDDTDFSYSHGFGWMDINGDDINDAFADANGDGVNDFTGHFYDHRGFMMEPGFTGGNGPHMDPGSWPNHRDGMM
jgi:hypothetical protein